MYSDIAAMDRHNTYGKLTDQTEHTHMLAVICMLCMDIHGDCQVTAFMRLIVCYAANTCECVRRMMIIANKGGPHMFVCMCVCAAMRYAMLCDI